MGVALRLEGSLAEYLVDTSSLHRNRIAFRIRRGKDWQEARFQELATASHRLAERLQERKILPGERVAIFAEASPEWVSALFASGLCGAMTIPLDTKLGEGEWVSILSHSEPRVILTSAGLEATARRIAHQLLFPVEVLVVDFRELAETGATPQDLKKWNGTSVRARDPFLIVYTSGTTSQAKGVMTSYQNLAFQVNALTEVVHAGPEDRFLSILPPNHLLELTCGVLTPFALGARVVFANTLLPDEIADLIRSQGITQMIGVPLFFRALKKSIEKQASQNPWQRSFFNLALKLSEWIPWKSMRRLLFRPLHRRLGGRLHQFICGGAPLEAEVARFFQKLGIDLLQGYGLTETSPVISVNTSRRNRLGSVGHPLPGVEVKLREGDGVVLTRGPHVMLGYYRREDLTREVIDQDGWFITGDVGSIDPEGYLKITGRVKDLIVLGSGKKVFPDDIELELQGSSLIQELCIVGTQVAQGPLKGTEEVCAVVVPASAQGGQNPNMEEIRAEMKRIAEKLANYKRPTRIVVRQDSLPLTSTRKIKRALVREWLNSQEYRV